MEFTVKKMAKVFKVSRAGYYKSVNHKEPARAISDLNLIKKINLIYKQSREIYGSPRIHAMLKKQGEKCSRKKVAFLMQVNNIQAKSRRKWKASNKACKDITKIAPNLINQKFEAPMPNQVWVSDITYIRTNEGWLYLAAIMDVFSRKIVGLGMSDRIDTDLISKAFNQAVCHRSPQPGLILHSDRGVQYTSSAYKHVTHAQGALLSMSAKGYCYDNAAMESFFHTLKTEHVYFYKYQTKIEAARSIFEYIEVFYNRQRIHSTLDYLSPLEFEQQNEQGIKKIGVVG